MFVKFRGFAVELLPVAHVTLSQDAFGWASLLQFDHHPERGERPLAQMHARCHAGLGIAAWLH
ncbi:hypothetical protein L2331_32295 [Mesorhizobium muleiense]|nr:hypothetical protein [Mesorhizobium muleiense]